MVPPQSCTAQSLPSVRASADLTLPAFVYGTAWKGDETAELVYQAIECGMRALDTASQSKHHREDLVGKGINKALDDGLVTRSDLYIQTKFSPVHSQDPSNMPYDPSLAILEQVRISVAMSLQNLGAGEDGNYIDCLLLHSALLTLSDTLQAWKACEEFVPGQVKHLGIANVELSLLKMLCSFAEIKPYVVQNRFFDQNTYDHDIRAFCKQQGIIYQAFWTLTANPHLLSCQPVAAIAHAAAVSSEAALYYLVLSLEGIVILNGTKHKERLIEDCAGLDAILKWTIEHSVDWGLLHAAFLQLIHEGQSK